jgi:hypothetical protein
MQHYFISKFWMNFVCLAVVSDWRYKSKCRKIGNKRILKISRAEIFFLKKKTLKNEKW